MRKKQVKKVTKLSLEGKKVIKINSETHARLARLGIKEDTFDTIIRRLLDEHDHA